MSGTSPPLEWFDRLTTSGVYGLTMGGITWWGVVSFEKGPRCFVDERMLEAYGFNQLLSMTNPAPKLFLLFK